MTNSAVPRMDDPVEQAASTSSRVERSDRAAEMPVITRSVRGRLVRLAYRFLWNVDDAEDVAHEALATAHERAADLRDETKWWSWVCLG